MVDRAELLKLVEKAQYRIRILGAVAFDLPYERFKRHWAERIHSGQLRLDIICESEPQLHYSSLVSSNRRVSGEVRSFDIGTFLNIQQEPRNQLRKYFEDMGCAHLEPLEDALAEYLRGMASDEVLQIRQRLASGSFDTKPFEQCFSLRTCYLFIPVPAIDIDDEYYIAPSMTLFCTQPRFEHITEQHVWREAFTKYFHAYFDAPEGAWKYSTEITKKDNRTEVILMHDDQRRLIGQLPRDSFLGSTKVKVVVWGLLFTRDGRLLIHKRGANAKDNRNMWDKSVGGHVDMERDVVDTVKAAAREMLEELFKVEQEAQGGYSKTEAMQVNEDKPIFLGEWRPEIRYTLPFSEISSKKDEIFFFRMSYPFSKKVVDSPRMLPDGGEMPVKVFADVYVFVMPEDFSTLDLKNSKYLLVEPHELAEAYLEGEIRYGTDMVPFNPTPDLRKIITGDLWPELNSFADYLREDT